MSLTTEQAIVTVTVTGTDLKDAPGKLADVLEPYPNARIVTLVKQSHWLNPMRCRASLLAVIEYDSPAAEQ